MVNKNHSILLEFVKRILIDTIFDPLIRSKFFSNPKAISELEMINAMTTPVPYGNIYGTFWPARAHTMIGLERLSNLQFCVDEVLKTEIEGDFIETGVWRGGASIFMRYILKEYGEKNKKVYVADSFEGLPPPDDLTYPLDRNDLLHTIDFLRVSLEEVQNNFREFNLLDDQVIFLKGWFSKTLKEPPFKKLSILRLDGDMYGSTWEVLENLYDKLSVGGYLIIDDYALHGCRAAVKDFRLKYNIKEPMVPIDWTGVYWQKGSFTHKLSEYDLSKITIVSLLERYAERSDLQNTFPEVINGDFSNLIKWSIEVVTNKISDSDYLYTYKDYLLNEKIFNFKDARMAKESLSMKFSKPYI